VPRLPRSYRGLWHPTAVRNGNQLLNLPGLRGSGMRPIARTPVQAFTRVVQGIPLTGGQASTTISAGSTSAPKIVQMLVISNALSGSFANPTTASNTVVVQVNALSATNGQVPAITGVTLGGAADHFKAGPVGVSAFVVGNYALAGFWYDYNCAGGQTAIAVSGNNLSVGASGNYGITIYEVSGLASGDPGDAVAAAGASAGGTAWSSGNGVPNPTSQASEIWFGTALTFGSTTILPAGWTNAQYSAAGGIAFGGYQIVSAAGTAVYSGTQSGADGWAAAVLTLKAAPPVFALPAGEGIVSVGPQGLGNVWYPAQCTISTTSGVNDNSTFSLYLGPAGVPVTLVGQAFPGGLGTLAVAVPSMTPGQYLIGVWTGGNPGDVASINVIGTMDTLTTA
jgi:hypothetical protein